MRHFATLFDQNYAARGLALHSSLVRHCIEPWTLHVLCMDEEAYRVLSELQPSNTRLYPLHTFETAMHMQPVKASRSWAEYCWTAASNFMEYLLSRNSFDLLTYLDADLFFFSDPGPVFAEIGAKSIAIVPHRFAPENRRLRVNGEFNVGWLSIRGNEAGRRCLSKWAAQCRDWCFHRNEGGKFGDQGYLDSWPADYAADLCIVQNIGVGVAPWNLQQYAVTDGPKVNGVPVVLYHYHEFKDAFNLTNYKLRPEDKRLIYEPYIEAIHAAKDALSNARLAIAARVKESEERMQRA